jgi:hypothetical protein
MEITDALGYAVVVGIVPVTIAIAAWFVITAGDTLLPAANQSDEQQ